MFTCMVFVFGALIEYCVVNVLARRQKVRQHFLFWESTLLLREIAVLLSITVENSASVCLNAVLSITDVLFLLELVERAQKTGRYICRPSQVPTSDPSSKRKHIVSPG